jgi:hypothetical protein
MEATRMTVMEATRMTVMEATRSLLPNIRAFLPS